MASLDPDVKKQFDELQKKMVETRSSMQYTDMQMKAKTGAIRHGELTASEIEKYTDETRMYTGTGRMFLLKPKNEVLQKLGVSLSDNRKAIEESKKSKIYLERVYKDSEESLRELLRHRT